MISTIQPIFAKQIFFLKYLDPRQKDYFMVRYFISNLKVYRAITLHSIAVIKLQELHVYIHACQKPLYFSKLGAVTWGLLIYYMACGKSKRHSVKLMSLSVNFNVQMTLVIKATRFLLMKRNVNITCI